MASRSRERLSLDERRARLLRLGRRLFSERPYDALSIDEIAAAAGMSKGLLYHYFPSKHRFYIETVREASHELRERTAPDPALPPLARLEGCVDRYLAYVEENAALYETVIRSGVGLDPEVRAIVEEYDAVVARWVLDALGIAEPRPAVGVALAAWIGAVRSASLEWVVRRALPRQDVRVLLVQMLVTAVTAAARLDPESGVPPPPGPPPAPRGPAAR